MSLPQLAVWTGDMRAHQAMLSGVAAFRRAGTAGHALVSLASGVSLAHRGAFRVFVSLG